MIVLFVPPVVAGAEEVAEAVARAVRAHPQADKPLLAAFISAGGVPASLVEADPPIATFDFPESAARALGHAADRAEWLRRPAGEVVELEGIDRPAAEALVRSVLALLERRLAHGAADPRALRGVRHPARPGTRRRDGGGGSGGRDASSGSRRS